MFVCCVLSGRGLCDELITHSPTDCGASLCVIKKLRGRGGHCPRWAAEPEKIIIVIITFTYFINNESVLVIQAQPHYLDRF
jgi:hypothetical protein